MKTRTIRQTVAFKASPHEVFELMMASGKHPAFTGGPAKISRRVGGKVEVYDGYIRGVNLEIVKDRRIVQTWQPEEDCWPKGHFSKVVFRLEKVRAGTRLTLTHSGVPVQCGKRFDVGWREFYWKPMKKMLEG